MNKISFGGSFVFCSKLNSTSDMRIMHQIAIFVYKVWKSRWPEYAKYNISNGRKIDSTNISCPSLNNPILFYIKHIFELCSKTMLNCCRVFTFNPVNQRVLQKSSHFHKRLFKVDKATYTQKKGHEIAQWNWNYYVRYA